MNGGDKQELWVGNRRKWSVVTAPLRPSSGDIRVYREFADAWLASTRIARPTLLVLGATTELCAEILSVPGDVLAMDNAYAMLISQMPRTGMLGGLCADWRRMPLAESSVDLIAGDGSFSVMPSLADYDVLMREIARVLRPEGRCIVRAYVRPDVREDLDAVFAGAARGECMNFFGFQWRLAQAVQESTERGVAIGDVLAALERREPDPARFAETSGWPIEHVSTIEAWRGSSVRFTFPTMREYRAVFARAGFAIVATSVGSFPMAERFPIFALERAS